MLRYHTNTAPPQVLIAAVDDQETELPVGSVAGFPRVPFLLGLERGTPNEEVVLCTAKGASSFTVVRGYDGTTARPHGVGTLIEHTAVATDYQRAITSVSGVERDSLVGDQLWDGRAVVNEDTLQLEVSVDNEWQPVLPVGAILPYAGSSAPVGFLLCQGQAVSRTTYAELFDLFGTTYGVGDGSTTFNLPDFRQRFPLGKAASGTGNTLGATGGSMEHVHAQTSHTHSVPNHTHSNPNTNSGGSHAHSQSSTGSGGSHNHGYFLQMGTGEIDQTGGFNSQTRSAGSHTHSNPNVNSSGSHTHSQGNTGSGGPGNTGSATPGDTGDANPPYATLNYIVRV